MNGLPVIVVAVTASISRHQYVRDNFCWISYQVIWSFAGPVAVILLVNMTALVVAIKIVVKKARYKETALKISALELEMRAAFKTLVILVPLLGVTWLVGFISIHNTSLVFQYLFAVMNSMQGLYFLIAQYWFDDDIKKNAHRASTRVKRLFSLSSTSSTSPGTGPSSKNKDQQGDRGDKNDQKQSDPRQHNNHELMVYNQNYNLQQPGRFDAIAPQQQKIEIDFPNDAKEPDKMANVQNEYSNDPSNVDTHL